MAEFKLELLGAQQRKPTPRSGCPAVSVVISLYNAEKFIGACLDSLLAQTLQGLEVVVVDDCSTDSSCAVVESYLPKFNGRLSLLHTEENSGGGSVPRNKGLNFSRGEYVFFADSDDFLAKSGLEDLYAVAKDFDADVVYCERNFETNEEGGNVRLVTHQKGTLVERPTIESAVLAERVNNILERDIWGAPWCKLVRRNFLIEHEITFPNVFPCEDYFWTLNLFFGAKNFVRVPNAIYFWRQTKKSSIRGKDTQEDKFNLWLNPAILGLKPLDKMLSKFEFFRNDTKCRHAILDFVVKKMFSMSFQAAMEIPQFKLYGGLKREFGDRLGEHDVLIPALCIAINTQQKITVMNQRKFNKVIAQNDKRIAALEAELKRLTKTK